MNVCKEAVDTSRQRSAAQQEQAQDTSMTQQQARERPKQQQSKAVLELGVTLDGVVCL
jgi:hypothetical protein